MKTAVVLSDTHGNRTDLFKIENILREADLIFHLGDGFFDLQAFDESITKKVIQVAGNCDGVSFDRERTVEAEGVKIFLTHGDLYGVRQGSLRLLLKAKEIGANVVFYGHTHVKTIEETDGIIIANPGTLTRYAAEKTFIYAVFQDGKAILKINDTAIV